MTVTVYVVVTAGDAVTGVPVEGDVVGDQEYPTPEDAVRVVVFPKQMAGGVAVAAVAGNGMTVTMEMSVLEHCVDAVVPVTVYWVVTVGLTETEDPIRPPGFHS